MAYSYPSTVTPFTREAVLAQLLSGIVPQGWVVLRANRLAMALQVVVLVTRLVGAIIFALIVIFHGAILHFLGFPDLTALPLPFSPALLEGVLIALAALGFVQPILIALAALGFVQPILIGWRSLAGGLAQTLIVTPEGFVVDGGPARAVPFAEVAAIKKRNWMLLHARRESFTDNYLALRITYRDGSTKSWQVDSRFGPPHAVQELIIGALAQYQRAHGLA